MGGLRRRLEKLEGTGGDRYEPPVAHELLMKEIGNREREGAGLHPLPFTEEEEAYIREVDQWFLNTYIPRLRETTRDKDSRAMLDQLEAYTRGKVEARGLR